MAAMTITKKNIHQVLNSGKPVLIDFWAPWCGPCRMAAPIVDEVAKEAAAKVHVGKIDIDSEPELAEQFGVMSIPTLVLMKDKKIAARSVGLKSKKAILKMIGG
ncbi:MAG: thioredoxin [Oscillospiraceae bacterium]|jgi:thioredoxin 1|nr:thioredoxin [Oscillospiraceae bacterium]